MGHWSVGHLEHHHDDVDDDSPDYLLEHHHILEHDDGTDMDDDNDTTDGDDLDNVVTDLIALHDSDYRLWHHRINTAPDDIRTAYWQRVLAGHWC